MTIYSKPWIFADHREAMRLRRAACNAGSTADPDSALPSESLSLI